MDLRLKDFRDLTKELNGEFKIRFKNTDEEVGVTINFEEETIEVYPYAIENLNKKRKIMSAYKNNGEIKLAERAGRVREKVINDLNELYEYIRKLSS